MEASRMRASPPRHPRKGDYMKKLSIFFRILSLVGVLAVVFAFLDIGRGFYNDYRWWFLGALWTGLIGNWLIDRKNAKQRTVS
ncbi:hypothetical protein SAMN04488127_1750 [Bhargavaea ginsengi]|uniref:Uncharacterized protein n=2 Tax=Bhargavaea ginsengi TaxID=426757 RepID=A0A1H6YPW1_9BACL|nr:hypothetical protein SAMN04488127_1750 [Bhargavaea ginsengi]